MLTKSMTEGNPLKVLILFSLPMILSVTLQQLYNLADNFIAGQFIADINSFNAVGIVYPITVIFLDIAVGLGVGIAVIIGRLFGARDSDNIQKTMKTGFITMVSLSIITMILGFIIIYPLLNSMIDSKECFNEALKYMLIYIGGVFFLFLYNFSMYIFQALGNSKTPLYFLIFSTLLNIALDFLFILVFNMKAEGLALGTVISEAIAGILSFYFLRRLIGKDNESKFDLPIFKKICLIATPSILQGLFISVGGVLIIAILSYFGGDNVAGGYSAAYKICYIAINIFVVLCNALSNYVSQNIGAKRYNRIIKGYLSILLISVFFCIIATLLILPFKEFWVELFLRDKGDTSVIIEAGASFISIVVPFFFLMVIKIPFDGILKGSADMFSFTLGTSLDLIVRVVIAFIFGLNFGYKGVFFAWPIGWAVGAICSVTMFFVGRWKKKSGYSLEYSN